jgi:hypothetical protein
MRILPVEVDEELVVVLVPAVVVDPVVDVVNPVADVDVPVVVEDVDVVGAGAGAGVVVDVDVAVVEDVDVVAGAGEPVLGLGLGVPVPLVEVEEDPEVVGPVAVEAVVIEPVVVVDPVDVDVEPAVVVLDEVPEDLLDGIAYEPAVVSVGDEVPEDVLDGIAYPSGCLRAATNPAPVITFHFLLRRSARKRRWADAVSPPATLTLADADVAGEDLAKLELASKLEPAASARVVEQRAPTGQLSP